MWRGEGEGKTADSFKSRFFFKVHGSNLFYTVYHFDTLHAPTKCYLRPPFLFRMLSAAPIFLPGNFELEEA